MRFLWPILLLPSAVLAGEIYTRDGVTDGDTFYLAPAAMTDDDPVYQSWVTFSLMRSACKLEIGGSNPARASSFECEYKSRSHLANAWREKLAIDSSLSDPYLDVLIEVQDAGYLAEYTTHYFGRSDWSPPDGLRRRDFKSWRRHHLRGHKPRTRITGSWNYRKLAPN